MRTLDRDAIDRAKDRAREWGYALRWAQLSGAPHPNCYSRTPYLAERQDHDHARSQFEDGLTQQRAERVHEFYQLLLGQDAAAAAALYIQYATYYPGTARTLEPEDRQQQWTSRTGKGKATYYRALQRATEGLARWLT